MHYRELTDAALEGVRHDSSDVDMARLAERVREKLLDRGSRGCAYVGDPHCVGVLRRWFPTHQPPLMNADTSGIRSPGSARLSYDAVKRGLERLPFMMDKNPPRPTDGPDAWKRWVVRRVAGGLRGQIIEAHVAREFRERFPDMYMPPENVGDLTLWCDHDFRLRVPGWRASEPLRVDVLGPRTNGEFGGMKVAADIHVVADIEGDGVAIRGFERGDNLRPLFGPEHTQEIAVLFVWLYCQRAGIDYEDARRACVQAAAA